jgi:hypothetical protein
MIWTEIISLLCHRIFSYSVWEIALCLVRAYSDEKNCSARHLYHVGFLLGFLVFFDPEDGGVMFLRIIGWLSTDYTASDTSLHNHCWENLKSYEKDVDTTAIS